MLTWWFTKLSWRGDLLVIIGEIDLQVNGLKIDCPMGYYLGWCNVLHCVESPASAGGVDLLGVVLWMNIQLRLMKWACWVWLFVDIFLSMSLTRACNYCAATLLSDEWFRWTENFAMGSYSWLCLSALSGAAWDAKNWQLLGGAGVKPRGIGRRVGAIPGWSCQ